MAEGNGPRTQELVTEVHELDQRVRERGVEIQGRLTTLETRLATIEGAVQKGGVDVEALKLRDQESRVTQRLTIAIGGLGGTLLISLVIFAATRA
jgi:hypothetical protein